jgi:hypothetical protein
VSRCLTFAEFLAYNEAGRAKRGTASRSWRYLAQPYRVPEDSTVWDLLDHMFVVEHGHLQRLRSEYPLPETPVLRAATGTA